MIPGHLKGKKTLSLKGSTVVVTGTFAAMSRREVEAKLKKAGAEVTGSVSKKTAYLVVGVKGRRIRQSPAGGARERC